MLRQHWHFWRSRQHDAVHHALPHAHLLLQPRRWGARPFIFFSPVQTGLPRELAKSLTRATQPGLVSSDCCDQAQGYHPASLSSESGESLRPDDVGCYSGGYADLLGTGMFRTPEACVSFLELYSSFDFMEPPVVGKYLHIFATWQNCTKRQRSGR